ncbi:MAG: amino acid permease [Anaerolineae bacterium]|nr:amino acid permease [Anaerolineae bacterium]
MSTIIRALAVGELELRDAIRVLGHELRIALLLGFVMASTAWIRAWTWGSGISLATVVALAIFLIVIWANVLGSTIHGYPSGGGAYTVAHDNLGVWPGLTAAAALLIDYVLTVSVSVTAGVAAITSAFPALFPFRIHLGLVAIVLVAWANLRGVRESGTMFAIPTYSFVVVLLALIVFGLGRFVVGNLSPAVARTVPDATNALGGLGLFLILRAFASGCAALTGVEAISNGIPAFEKPEAKNAGKTLIAMAALLATMFLGITLLAHLLGITPSEEETVISQIGRHVFGQGAPYLGLQIATMLILVLAANTSFAGFPRLTAILARARYLPNQLANLGDRLVFNNGIVVLACLASGLIILFGGETHRLIPLYAVGVFLSFTLSQAGMVRHWAREHGQGWRWKMAINGLGALTTGIVLSVIVASKFLNGAWIVILIIPSVIWMFQAIRRHYATVAEQLSLEKLDPKPREGLVSHAWHKVLVPVASLHRGTLVALHFARTLSSDVTAVIVDTDPQITARVQEKWDEWGHGLPLVVLESPYRSTVGPLLDYLEQVDRRDPDHGLAVVVLPEFVPARWWHHLLHNQTALLIKTILLYQRRTSDQNRIIINVPYHLNR